MIFNVSNIKKILLDTLRIFLDILSNRFSSRGLLRQYSNGKRNFRGAKLIGQSFKGANLSGIDLSNSVIRACDFSNANLSNSDFSGAKFDFSIGQYIYILVHGPLSPEERNFDFTLSIFEVIVALSYGLSITLLFLLIFIGLLFRAGFGFTPVLVFIVFLSFTLMQESSKFIKNINSSYSVIFSGSKIKNSNFKYASINRCDFRKSDLRNSNFECVKSTAINFQESNLDFITWHGFKYEESHFPIDEEIIILCSTLNGIGKSFSHIKVMSNLNLSNVDLHGANLEGINFSGAIFDGANLNETLISNSNLKYAQFGGTLMSKADLSKSDISFAEFKSTRLIDANLSEVRAVGAKFLEGTDLSGACIANWIINANSTFQNIKCDYIYLDCSYREGTVEYLQRVPREQSINLDSGDFEKIVGRFYQVMAIVFESALMDADEISANIDQLDVQLPKQSEKLASLEKALQRESLDIKEKNELLNVLRQRRAFIESALDVWQGRTDIGGVFNLVMLGDNSMLSNVGGQQYGGNSSQSNISLENTSGPLNVAGSSSAPMQAVSSGRDTHANQQNSSESETLSQDDVISLINHIYELFQHTNLPIEIAEAAESYAKLAKIESEKDVPNKRRIVGNLEGAIELVQNLDTVTDETKGLIEKLREPVTKLATWLGIAATHFLL
ncbi:putative low-complexity protein [Leptolyngbya sp. PCC 7375]|nr:putative low-complexity protein [Leptolyngbya sp. PCC 7375]